MTMTEPDEEENIEQGENFNITWNSSDREVLVL